MILFLSDYKKAANDQAKAKTMTPKTAAEPSPQQDTGSKGHQHTSAQLIVPAHKNTPCMILCRGCCQINRQDRLFGLRRFRPVLRRYR